MTDEQYKLISARRNAANQLMWQVPTLAMAAQAFLLAAAFNPLIDPNVSLILAGFSLVAGIASIQLMAKHRYFEMVDSELLMNFERANAEKGFDILHGPHKPVEGVQANWFVRIKSFRVWIVVLSGFCALALIALYSAATRHNEPRAAIVGSPGSHSQKIESPPTKN